MRSTNAVLACVLFPSSLLVACSSSSLSSDESEENLQSSSHALRKVGEESDDPPPKRPPPPPPPPPTPCPSVRYDLYRSTLVSCEMPPASPGGTWTKEPLFPNAPSSIRDRFCAYTWQPSGNVPSCAPAPFRSIPVEADTWEEPQPRGHCPMSQPGCGPSTAGYTGPGPWNPGGGVLAPVTGSFAQLAASSGGDSPTASNTTAKTTATAPGSGHPPLPGSNAVPVGTAGCCDACGFVHENRAWLVLPPTDVGSVSFWATVRLPSGASENRYVTVSNPRTDLVEVGLDPAYTWISGNVPWIDLYH